ncbi:MAG TPA: bacillithiol biosynthesis cysteine-adding enzyme BshC [Blastocatellia bacterium]|nr:bacillithiol biosynthesis cysteine-adding enzyme BshC [Blastocatellia bacterium]
MNKAECTDLESAAGVLDGAIRFTDIPRTSRLFADFLYDYPKVAAFYSDSGRASAPLADSARQVGAMDFDRSRVPDALDRINRRAGSPDLTFKHIDALRKPGTVAVVTGQQAGLFTGPLYTIHKALTAIKLSRCLNESGVEAVPVFWIATEDHDYEEVNHCRVLDRDGRIKEVRYDACERIADTPVGSVGLCANIGEKIDEFISSLPPSEFVPEFDRDLRESYAPGDRFGDGFARLLARLFRAYGVVLLDPMDDELKQVTAPLYRSAIERSREIAAGLERRSGELERAGYHAQVHVSSDMVPLFIMEEGRRVAMVESGGRFTLKGSDHSFSRADLLSFADQEPERFSPSVALRPVVQDYLLPTAAYIAGPAEIAYFAQLGAVYEALGRRLPCILPRASITLVEPRHRKVLEKYGLGLPDFFEGLHRAVTKVVEQGIDRDTANTFSETERLFNDQLDKLEGALRRSDATLAASVTRAREKVVYQLEHLRTRFVHASARREEATYRQIERACTTLYPDKNLQERELNCYSFLFRYGPKLIDQLYEAVDIGYSNHRLVDIEGGPSKSAAG